RNSALLKTRTYLGLLTPCLPLHGSQRMIHRFFNKNYSIAYNNLRLESLRHLN
ncbi:hypothetical protein K661_00940, partial [Piscirickettsia salmonis LF-89 = ATCC VR-1361]